jgi:superfamily I DNA/RNA helicase
LEQLRTLTAGGYPFVPPGASGVQVETIHRFKGLESPVVVLVITDPPVTINDYARTLLYVGTSRARSFLLVLGPRRVKEWLGLRP